MIQETYLFYVCGSWNFQVVLADFFLGDQLTSQVASFRNVEFMLCYFSGGYFQDRNPDACTHNAAFRVMMYVFSLLPYWFRFMQVIHIFLPSWSIESLFLHYCCLQVNRSVVEELIILNFQIMVYMELRHIKMSNYAVLEEMARRRWQDAAL